MLKNILMWVSMSVVVSGWFSSDLNLQIRFEQIMGLKTGDRIVFEQNVIGEVARVVYEKEGTYLVDAEIRHEFKNAATNHSHFFIAADPSEAGRKAIEMVTEKGKGDPLEDGAVVEGSTKLSVLLEQMEDDVAKSVGDMKETFRKFAEELKEVPDSLEIRRLQEYLGRLLEEMKQGDAFREMVQKDLLPRLQEEIEKLKERLEKSGREKEVEPLQTQMDEMRKI